MAEELTAAFGTEKDKVNCPFFFKVGACRHGEKCSRLHHRPEISQTILIPHMYQNPAVTMAQDELLRMDPRVLEDQFCDFYEDVYDEMAKYGKVEDIVVCDNICEHLVGNVYVRFSDEAAAKAALEGVRGRKYAGRTLFPEFTPVTDFHDAQCRQFATNQCNKGGFCNFMHQKHVPSDLARRLFGHRRRDDSRERSRRDRHRRSRSRSRSRSRHSRHGSHRHRSHRHRSRSTSSSRSRSSSRSSSSSRSPSPRRRADDTPYAVPPPPPPAVPEPAPSL